MIRLGVVVLCVAFGGTALAEEQRPATVLWAHPLDAANRILRASGEWRLDKHLTVGASARVGGNLFAHDSFFAMNERSLSGAVGAGLSWFFFGNAPAGLWVGPRLEGGGMTVRSSFSANDSQSTTSVGGWFAGASLLVGYTAIMPNGFSMQVGAGFGGGFSRTSGSMTAGGTTMPIDGYALGIGPKLELGLGWAF